MNIIAEMFRLWYKIYQSSYIKSILVDLHLAYLFKRAQKLVWNFKCTHRCKWINQLNLTSQTNFILFKFDWYKAMHNPWCNAHKCMIFKRSVSVILPLSNTVLEFHLACHTSMSDCYLYHIILPSGRGFVLHQDMSPQTYVWGDISWWMKYIYMLTCTGPA